MTQISLSIIIPSFNTKKRTISCIKSILKNPPFCKFELIIVENGSVDGTYETLISKYGETGNIRIIKNRENRGFAKACNQGIRKAIGMFILLLNSDTLVQKGSLTNLVNFAKDHSDAGVVGSRLMNSDGSIQPSCFNLPNLSLAIRQYWFGKKGLMEKYFPKGEKPKEVEAVVGAAFLITPMALKKVGFLDEKYFMYFEDLDYCRRVKKSGLKVYYLPDSNIIHIHGESGKNLVEKKDQWRRLISGSKIYHGVFIHSLITFIIWSSEKIRKLKYYEKNKLILVLILSLSLFLRIWKISDVPVSLFGDELDVGYHAYSIIKTGKDYSGNPWPMHFHSLAEWRTPLYLYASVPTVYFFGISPLGVRLPAVIFGVLSIWGIYLFVKEFLEYNSCGKVENNTNCSYEYISLLSAFFLSVSPWHLQYSRAAFEVTMLLSFLLFGLYFFFKSLNQSSQGSLLWVSVLLLVLTPYIYSTAKLFTPLLMLTLFILFKKKLLKSSKKYLIIAVLTGLVFGIPISYSTIFGGGTQRFNYISVFTDPAMEGDVGFARLNDAKMIQSYGGGVVEKITARVIHNKYTFWGEKIIDNIFAPFSADFLFNRGDPNLRHSIEGMGQLYKTDIIGLVLGIGYFFFLYGNKKSIIFILLWIVFAVMPSSITRDGGNHATRLIILLPPLIFLISYGLVKFILRLSIHKRIFFIFIYILLLTSNICFYSHNYWIHNPWYSERWWHSGFKETFEAMREVEGNYDKIIISDSNEPPLIFFLAWNQFPPDIYQKGLEEENLDGFGTIKHLGKYYFGNMGANGIYALDKYIDENSLYIAVAKEVVWNLILDPSRVPAGLNLVKAIPYPSGEPAYYLFEKVKSS